MTPAPDRLRQEVTVLLHRLGMVVKLACEVGVAPAGAEQDRRRLNALVDELLDRVEELEAVRPNQ